MFVGPVIMATFVEADLKACLFSMLTGFALNVYLVLYAQVGWVEAPILQGLGGCVVYIVMVFFTNGMILKAAKAD